MARQIKVICKFCGQFFDRNNEPYIKLNNRYAHPECYKKTIPNGELEAVDPKADEKPSGKSPDETKLIEYIKQLFSYKSIPVSVQKQINQYVIDYQYTYTGMLQSLVYYYEIKKGSKEKAQGRIGIIPYIYEEAHNYYLDLWKIQQINDGKSLDEMIPKQRTVIIPLPEPKKEKSSLFSFLDEEVEH